MISLTPHTEGVVLPIRAQPGARKNSIVGEHDGALKVAVTAPPEDGKANKALIEVLSKALKVKRSQLELIGGQTSRDKRFVIRGVSVEQLQQRVAELVS